VKRRIWIRLAALTVSVLPATSATSCFTNTNTGAAAGDTTGVVSGGVLY
jgi:hypothetical protein